MRENDNYDIDGLLEMAVLPYLLKGVITELSQNLGGCFNWQQYISKNDKNKDDIAKKMISKYCLEIKCQIIRFDTVVAFFHLHNSDRNFYLECLSDFEYHEMIQFSEEQNDIINYAKHILEDFNDGIFLNTDDKDFDLLIAGYFSYLKNQSDGSSKLR